MNAETVVATLILLLLLALLINVRELLEKVDRLYIPPPAHSYPDKGEQDSIINAVSEPRRVLAKANSSGKDDLFDEPDWDAARKRMAKTLYDDARREGRTISMNEADAMATDLIGGFLGG